MTPLKIYLNKTVSSNTKLVTESIANDLRLHSLNTFLDALNEGLADSDSACPESTANFESMVNSMFAAIARKLNETDSKGKLFTIAISSTTDPASNKLTWTFDFHADLRRISNP